MRMTMDSSRLAARLNDILRPRQGSGSRPERPAIGRRLPSVEAAARTLGASRWPIDRADCLVVERTYSPDLRHGLMSVGEYAQVAARSAVGLKVFAGGPGGLIDGPAQADDQLRRQLFFDLETTGLAGGTGTYAFLIGFGYFDGPSFETRQFFLADYADERDVLRAVEEFVAPASGLVTFNGRTFDLPLIATRYAMHRMRSPFDELAHVDMLHPARRLWRRRRETDVPGRSTWPYGTNGRGGVEYASCALVALERAILGFQRVGDVPGAEIPGRYFEYIRRGDAAPLVDVFEHNRLDLVSLAALTAVVLSMVEGGGQATRNPRECLALGRMFEQMGQPDRARACFAQVARLSDAPWQDEDGDDLTRAEALRRLAVHLRRERRHDEAAVLWQQLVEIDVGQPALVREATEALAIHQEHRVRDLSRARELALRALEVDADEGAREAVRRRLARLDRKLSARLDPGSRHGTR
jgi:uncharacterized protein YprB with RNaseH-like and TPR domain